MCSDLGDDYLIRIGINYQVRVVSDDYDLALALCCLEKGDELIVHGFWVEVFLGLIDDDENSRICPIFLDYLVINASLPR